MFRLSYHSIMIAVLVSLFLFVTPTWANPPELPSTFDWTADNVGVDVLDVDSLEEIEGAFNAARAWEASVLADDPEADYLPMPEMDLSGAFTWDEWTALSPSEQGLWLMNDARTARGLRPFEGVDPHLEAIGQTYIQFLVGNNLNGHTADGSNPYERMVLNDEIGASCVEVPVLGETISYFQGVNNQIFPSDPVSLAVYQWIYRSNNHRRHVLSDVSGWNDNSGEMGKEGLISLAFLEYTGTNYDPPGLSLDYSGGVQIAIFDYYDPSSSCDNVPQAAGVTPLAVTTSTITATPPSVLIVLFGVLMVWATVMCGIHKYHVRSRIKNFCWREIC